MPEIVFKVFCMGLGLGTVYLTLTKTATALRTGVFAARRGDYHRDRHAPLFWASIVASLVFAVLGLFLAWAGWRWPERVL